MFHQTVSAAAQALFPLRPLRLCVSAFLKELPLHRSGLEGVPKDRSEKRMTADYTDGTD